jgi:hypothetical protein
MIMLAITAIYAAGFVFFATGNNVATDDKRRFWPALLLWPITLLIGVVNSALNRAQR